MCNTVCEIKIGFTKNIRDHLSCGRIYTYDQNIFDGISALGYTWRSQGYEGEFLCEIVEPEKSVKLDLVRQVLLGSGLKEISAFYIPSELRRSHFSFRYIRSFDKSTIDSAKYLRIHLRGASRIASNFPTRDTSHVIMVDKRLNKNINFGWLNIVNIPYCDESARSYLSEAGIIGCQFEDAIYDKPQKVSKKLYQLTSSVTLPPCLLPLKNEAGETILSGDPQSASHWDDSGHVPPILKYRRNELEKMGIFDYAKTYERSGNTYSALQYVVSQRFKKCLEGMNVKCVQYIPVEIIG